MYDKYLVPSNLKKSTLLEYLGKSDISLITVLLNVNLLNVLFKVAFYCLK